ncbi:MAG TPA: methyltransferase domain-containing protein [Blastocatellia bacterium]|nr:methyltransferase domain-containing protein [Blastocatellia bacterium]
MTRVRDNKTEYVTGMRAAVAGLDEAKLRAREQWTANPCGAHVARELEFGSREYFDTIDHYRYNIYSPWIKELIDFNGFAGKRLLEIGCGTGTDLVQFARGGASVIGVDLTPRSIEIARRRFEVFGLSGDFAVGDAERLTFPDEAFDVVYSFGVLHHTPGTEAAVDEIYRVLRKGGRAIVMLYNRSSLWYWVRLVLMRGLLGGELLKSNTGEMLSKYVEYTETGARPLVKTYSRREARRLFRRFGNPRIQVEQLNRSDLRWLGRVLPERFIRWTARTVGWNIIVTAVKR